MLDTSVHGEEQSKMSVILSTDGYKQNMTEVQVFWYAICTINYMICVAYGGSIQMWKEQFSCLLNRDHPVALPPTYWCSSPTTVCELLG